MITIKRESFKEKYDEAYPLFIEHAKELATYQDIMKLKPKTERYALLEDTENLISIYAYNDEELIGYSINFVQDHVHYSDLIFVQNDVLFVKKEYRGMDVGSLLLEATEKEAYAEGADIVLLHAKEDTKLTTILPTKGYRIQDIIYSKVL